MERYGTFSQMITPKFLVSEEDGKWQLRASNRRVFSLFCMMLFGGLLMIAGGILIDKSLAAKSVSFWFNRVFTAAGCAMAILLWGLGAWIGCTRKVPLTIDLREKSLHIGGKQIAGAGDVESILVRRPSSLAEDEDRYSIAFRLTDGRLVELPLPAFAWIGDESHTTELAEQMAAKLQVPVLLDF